MLWYRSSAGIFENRSVLVIVVSLSVSCVGVGQVLVVLRLVKCWVWCG